jgi:hypothetical protein
MGVVKLGEVAKANTVPLPVVLYEVPQAVPVELGMPEPGYTIGNELLTVIAADPL